MLISRLCLTPALYGSHNINAMQDEVIDLTGSPGSSVIPNAVTPSNGYHKNSLSMTFWEVSGQDDDELDNIPFTPDKYSRTMKLVLIYLRGEQDKFRGITESRGQNWLNSWSASIRSEINYWEVYGREPNWWGKLNTIYYGIGKNISKGIKQSVFY